MQITLTDELIREYNQNQIRSWCYVRHVPLKFPRWGVEVGGIREFRGAVSRGHYGDPSLCAAIKDTHLKNTLCHHYKVVGTPLGASPESIKGSWEKGAGNGSLRGPIAFFSVQEYVKGWLEIYSSTDCIIEQYMELLL